jgi:hypothetical protein
MRRFGAIPTKTHAIEAASQWRFRPGTKDGEPVSTHATVQMNFSLLKDH